MSRLLEVTLPPLHEKQLEIEADPARFKMVRAGRRFGKTKFGVTQIVKVGLEGGRAWWVAPTYKLANPGWRDLRFLADQIPGAITKLGSREIVFPGGGEAAIRTAVDPTNLRAEGLDLVVLDEAAYQPEDVWWESLRPTLIDRGGRALFISTPAGMTGWLYELWHQQRDADNWSLFHFSSYDNPFLPPEELDGLREEMGEHAFQQEIMAEFVELSGSTFRRAWIKYFTEEDVTVENDEGEESIERAYVLADGTEILKDDCSVYITCDPALSTKEEADYTVFAVWARSPDRKHRLLLHVTRVHLEAPDIVPMGGTLLREWGGTWIGFENVAFQASLVQFARRDGLPAFPLKADRDKRARALPLAAQLEAGRVQFREGAAWLQELERELLLFPNSPHDDQVDALAYGVIEDRVRRTLTAR